MVGARARFGRIDTTTPAPLTAPDCSDSAVRAWADWVITSLLADDPSSYCGVLVLDANAAGLRLVGERWRGEAAADPAPGDGLVPLDGTVCGTVFRTAAPVLVSDVQQHPGHRPLPGHAMRSELAVPVLRAGHAIGVIKVESTRVGGLDIADLHRLTALSAEAAELAPTA